MKQGERWWRSATRPTPRSTTSSRARRASCRCVAGSFRAPAADAPVLPQRRADRRRAQPRQLRRPAHRRAREARGREHGDADARMGGQPIQGQGYAIGVDRVKELIGGLRSGPLAGLRRASASSSPTAGRRSGGARRADAGRRRPASGVSLLLGGQRRAADRLTFAGYCDAVRSIKSGADGGAHRAAEAGRAAASSCQVKFLARHLVEQAAQSGGLRRARHHVAGQVRALLRVSARGTSGSWIQLPVLISAVPALVARVRARAVRVAEDHVRRLDPEPLDHLAHPAQRGLAAARLAGQVGASAARSPAGSAPPPPPARPRRPQQQLGTAAEESPLSQSHSSDRTPLAPHRALSRGGLRQRVAQRVHGRQRGLVVVRARAAGRHAAANRCTAPIASRSNDRHRVVHVQVVAVHGVDVVAHPHARVRDRTSAGASAPATSPSGPLASGSATFSAASWRRPAAASISGPRAGGRGCRPRA